MSDFWDYQVPLPPLPEQRRIAAILDQTDALRAKRREALAQLDSLTQSIFIEMFGDERTQAGRWPVVRFDEIVRESRIGLVRGSQELDQANPYPYLRMNAINRDGDLRLEGALRAQATDEEVDFYRLKRGDFLFNTRNSRELVGKTALFRSESPRELRRLISLRGLSNDKGKQVFTRGARTRCSHGSGAPRRVPVAVGGH